MTVEANLRKAIGQLPDQDHRWWALAQVALTLAQRIDSPGTESKDLPRLSAEFQVLMDRLLPEGDVPDIVAGLGVPE